jgi:hypothetical protein
MNRWIRRLFVLLLSLCCLAMTGCSGNVGVGMSVGVPVGSHGRVHVSGHRWL